MQAMICDHISLRQRAERHNRQRRPARALADLALLPLRRVGHVALLDRIWELRDDVTVYDGAYVALAELASATLVTADARLSRAPGVRCAIEILA